MTNPSFKGNGDEFKNDTLSLYHCLSEDVFLKKNVHVTRFLKGVFVPDGDIEPDQPIYLRKFSPP